MEAEDFQRKALLWQLYPVDFPAQVISPLSLFAAIPICRSHLWQAGVCCRGVVQAHRGERVHTPTHTIRQDQPHGQQSRACPGDTLQTATGLSRPADEHEGLLLVTQWHRQHPGTQWDLELAPHMWSVQEPDLDPF